MGAVLVIAMCTALGYWLTTFIVHFVTLIIYMYFEAGLKIIINQLDCILSTWQYLTSYCAAKILRSGNICADNKLMLVCKLDLICVHFIAASYGILNLEMSSTHSIINILSRL